MKRIKTEKVIAHPLEEAFNIEPNTTIAEFTEGIPEEVIQLPDYDQKDNEIEGKLEEIYTKAMNQVDLIADASETVEGKYKGRMGEVVATMLNVALAAVHEKTVLKVHKDKLMAEKTNTAVQRGGTINNNLVVTADRNELLKMLLNAAPPETTPGDLPEMDITDAEDGSE